jgi:acetoin utilization deacetylase AcuC-like enzyme
MDATTRRTGLVVSAACTEHLTGAGRAEIIGAFRDRLVSTLEGGYNLAGLAAAAASHVKALVA